MATASQGPVTAKCEQTLKQCMNDIVAAHDEVWGWILRSTEERWVEPAIATQQKGMLGGAKG